MPDLGRRIRRLRAAPGGTVGVDGVAHLPASPDLRSPGHDHHDLDDLPHRQDLVGGDEQAHVREVVVEFVGVVVGGAERDAEGTAPSASSASGGAATATSGGALHPVDRQEHCLFRSNVPRTADSV